MALPLGVPLPSEPWQDAQYVPNTSWPLSTFPAVFAAYEGGLAPSRPCLRPHREKIPFVSTSICCSVSMPPADCANAGIDVPSTPLVTLLRIVVSSTMARYTGLARAIDAPPRPSVPWQAAQFCAYRVLKSETWLGATGAGSVRGSRFRVLQAASITRLRIASSDRILIRFIAGSPRALVVESFREPRFRPVTRTKHFLG